MASWAAGPGSIRRALGMTTSRIGLQTGGVHADIRNHEVRRPLRNNTDDPPVRYCSRLVGSQNRWWWTVNDTRFGKCPEENYSLCVDRVVRTGGNVGRISHLPFRRKCRRRTDSRLLSSEY